MSTVRAIPAAETSRPMLYLALTKPDVSFLVVMTTLAGYYLGSRGPLDWLRMAHTVFGTTLVAAGTSALNHFIERVTDARMRRTADASAAERAVACREACAFGAALVAIGAVYLALTAGIEASLLGLFTCAMYLAIYTPLKKRTALATAIGAIPGAMPPLIGWVAAGRSLNIEALVLFAVLFLWQFPHFMAISWMYREDYARAGLRMIPPGDQGAGTRYVFDHPADGAGVAAGQPFDFHPGPYWPSLFLRCRGRGVSADSGLPVGRAHEEQCSRQMADARNCSAPSGAARIDDVR